MTVSIYCQKINIVFKPFTSKYAR